jgi:HD-like signal output (HDOD) protein
MPNEFKAALTISQTNGTSLHAALQQTIGADHVIVGAMLVEKWRFAPHLVETIRHQHVSDFRDTDMIACVFGANQISKKLKFGFGGNPCIDEFPASVQKRLGGNMDEVIASMGDLNALFEEAKIFAKL